MSKQSLYMISSDEMNLIKRLRQLQAGIHCVIIISDGIGPTHLSVASSAKLERIRRQQENEETVENRFQRNTTAEP